MSTTDGSEDGNLYLKVMKSGTLREAIMCDRTEVVVNNDSVDMDFRVESDSNTHAFFVRGSDGNLGIGVVPETTYSTWQAVQIAGTGNLFGERSQAANQQIVLGQNVYMDAGGDFTHLVTDEASYYRQYAGTHAFFVAPSGSADATLSTSKALEIINNGRVSINKNGLGTNFGDAACNIGHTATTPLLELHVNHTTAYGCVKFMNGNGEVGSIGVAASATSFNTSSDYRLKENVDYDWDATTRLKQLKPARFNWKADDTNTLVDGFIAHEVSSVVPEAVTGDKDAMRDVTDEDGNVTSVADYQGIDQSKLVPLLVKTIQELEARITALEG